MGPLDYLFKLASLGATGVAIYALYIWHDSYRTVVLMASAPSPSQIALSKLLQQLKSFSILAVLTLVAAVSVQLAELVINRVSPPTPLTAYDVKLIISPSDVLDDDVLPSVRHDGESMKPSSRGFFKASIAKESNFDVNVIGLRDKLGAAQRTNIELTKQLQAVPNSPYQKSTGFDDLKR